MVYYTQVTQILGRVRRVLPKLPDPTRVTIRIVPVPRVDLNASTAAIVASGTSYSVPFFELKTSTCSISRAYVEGVPGGGTTSNRVAKQMGTYFEMEPDGHRFVCFQIGIC